MPHADQQLLQRLAYEAWVRRGRPIGSPEVDWAEALRSLEPQSVDQEMPPSDPGSLPTDLGAEPPPERSHDGLQKRPGAYRYSG